MVSCYVIPQPVPDIDPGKAGIQSAKKKTWIPAFAGMTI